MGNVASLSLSAREQGSGPSSVLVSLQVVPSSMPVMLSCHERLLQIAMRALFLRCAVVQFWGVGFGVRFLDHIPVAPQ